MKKSWQFLIVIGMVIIIFLIFDNSFSLSNRKEKMLDLGYEVEILSADEISGIVKDIEKELGLNLNGYFNINTALGCFKDSKGEMIIAIWFMEKEDAREFEEGFDSIGLNAKDILGVSGKYGTKGEIFYMGTLQACDDFLSW